ncbi:homeobox protein cut [Uranotaenia lowii]|uniref:homeobox protein cut n=1 Tax=Uranotaenia lowii TaxID=190385 RepID=UPI00247A7841|nr:homeobox protein cut [Uranotaenia lowii]
MEQARVHSKGKHRSSRSGSSSRRVSSSSGHLRSDQVAVVENGGSAREDDEVAKNRASVAGPIAKARSSQPLDENVDSGSTTTNASYSANGSTVQSSPHNNNNIVDPAEDEDAAAAIDGNRNASEHPLETATSVETVPGSENIQKGILGYMDRQLKVQSLSDPQKSPAQRSTRSRSSLDKSPRRKRSKSESRRRRERKIIAAGEMEVRQANETLMRYLKQCSDFNDASLSGDLEIPENLEDRRVHRKTRWQRERNKQHQQQNVPSKPTGDDTLNYHGEIYNPFTPVVSPTTDSAPTRIDKMYIQTASGYRPVDNTYHNSHHHHLHHHQQHHHHSHSHLRQLRTGGPGGDPESNNYSISTAVHLSCAVQRLWLHLANVCHGLLGGLALAHLLLICTTKPYDWVEASIRHYSAYAEVYANTFYCLAIVCMVSIFDRIDISHFSMLMSHESGNISFRSVIIIMIYTATVTLSLSAGSMDERLYLSSSNVTVWEEELETNKVLSLWNTLSIARSVGAISGWLIVGMSPNGDQLYDHLVEMERYQLQ